MFTFSHIIYDHFDENVRFSRKTRLFLSIKSNEAAREHGKGGNLPTRTSGVA